MLFLHEYTALSIEIASNLPAVEKPKTKEFFIRRVYDFQVARYRDIQCTCTVHKRVHSCAVLNAVDHPSWPSHMAAIFCAIACRVDAYTYKKTSACTCIHTDIHTYTQMRVSFSIITASSRLSLDGSRGGVVRHALIISSSFPYLRGTSVAPVVSSWDIDVICWYAADLFVDLRISASLVASVRTNFYIRRAALSKAPSGEIYSVKPIVEACRDRLTCECAIFLRAFLYAGRWSISLYVCSSFSLSRWLSLAVSVRLEKGVDAKTWVMRREIDSCPGGKTRVRFEGLLSTREIASNSIS